MPLDAANATTDLQENLATEPHARTIALDTEYAKISDDLHLISEALQLQLKLPHRVTCGTSTLLLP